MPGISSLRLSADGHQLAIDQTTGNNPGVWVLDLDRGTPDRLTSNSETDRYARFSPDGKQIVFSSIRSGLPRIFIRPSVSNGTDQPLDLETPPGMRDFPHDWSRDSKYIVFVRAASSSQGTDIWVKPMFGDGKPFALVQSKLYINGEPRVSPNGRWLAYSTDRNGQRQIRVHTFPDPNGNEPTVTADGGMFPTWKRDGSELYYLAQDGNLMAVTVKEDGDQLALGTPKVLFQSPVTSLRPSVDDPYDVSPDGNRFVFLANTNPVAPTDPDKLMVILKWTAALRKK